MMRFYLEIITTVLVITQVIRLIQNAVSLHRQSVVVKKSIADLDFENADIEIRKSNDRNLAIILPIIKDRLLDDKLKGCNHD